MKRAWVHKMPPPPSLRAYPPKIRFLLSYLGKPKGDKISSQACIGHQALSTAGILKLLACKEKDKCLWAT